MNFIYSKLHGSEKPKDARPYQKKSNYIFADMQIKDIAAKIGEGRAWRAGIYNEDNGTFKKVEVLGSYIIALDFDCCVYTPEQITEYAESVGIQPNFYYYSFSQGIKPQNNFRVVWVFENIIDKKTYERLYIAMLQVFKEFEPDAAVKDCSRLWYGTIHKPEIINEQFTTMAAAGWINILSKYSEVKEKRSIIRGKRDFIPEYAAMAMPDAVDVGERWFNALCVRCELWDKWVNGTYLNYNQRLTLFTNLKFIKYGTHNGSSVFKDIMQFYKSEVYAGHTCNEEQIAAMLRDRTLRPLPIVLDGNERVTVPEFFKREKERPELNPIEKVSVEVLDEWMNENVPAFLNRGGIEYLQSQTASGKTQRIIEWLCEQDLFNKKIIYAAPHYNGIEEFAERFSKAAPLANMFVMPKATLTKRDILLLQMGLPKETSNSERAHLIKQMVDDNSKGLYIISHALLVNLREFKADMIIIDENCEDALLRETTFSKTQLGGIYGYLTEQKNKEKLLNVIDTMNEKQRGDLINITPLKEILPDFIGHINEYIQDANKTDVASGFFNVLHTDYAKISTLNNSNVIRFVIKSPLIQNALDSGTPIKLFCATPKYGLLTNFFSKEINIIKAPLAQNKGRVIQYTGYSGARGQNNEKVAPLMEYILTKLPTDVIQNAPIFTFNGTEDKWRAMGFHAAENNNGTVHLNNNAGLDVFKGKSIIVAGKFDYNNEYYYNLYFDLHPDAEGVPERQNQIVSFGGRQQKLYLFVDEDLKKIQLENMIQTLEQTAGRARALREIGATVYVFANLVIEDADEVYK